MYVSKALKETITLKVNNASVTLPHFSGLDYSTTWRDSYESAHASLSRSLHITHPVMQATLALWDKYRQTLLIDLTYVRY